VSSDTLATVSQIVASTGVQINSIGVGHFPGNLCFDGTNVWVTNSNDGTVTEIVASTASVSGTFSVGSSSYTPIGICFDGTYIWTANKNVNNVSKILASNGSLINTYSVGSAPTAVCFDGTYIWTANASGSVTKLIASTGVVIGTYSVGVSSYRSAICSDGTYIWVTYENSNLVYQMLASSGAITNTFNVGSTPGISPEGVCYDGVVLPSVPSGPPSGNIWCANMGTGTVSKIPD